MTVPNHIKRQKIAEIRREGTRLRRVADLPENAAYRGEYLKVAGAYESLADCFEAAMTNKGAVPADTLQRLAQACERGLFVLAESGSNAKQ